MDPASDRPNVFTCCQILSQIPGDCYCFSHPAQPPIPREELQQIPHPACSLPEGTYRMGPENLSSLKSFNDTQNDTFNETFHLLKNFVFYKWTSFVSGTAWLETKAKRLTNTTWSVNQLQSYPSRYSGHPLTLHASACVTEGSRGSDHHLCPLNRSSGVHVCQAHYC